VVVPLTMAAVPVALSSFRHRIGTWIMFVGMAANLAAILANGGLMPIERSTLVEAIGEERAAQYETGHWVSGSKDVLVGPGSGRLVALGDSIIIRLGDAGIVASPGTWSSGPDSRCWPARHRSPCNAGGARRQMAQRATSPPYRRGRREAQPRGRDAPPRHQHEVLRQRGQHPPQGHTRHARRAV